MQFGVAGSVLSSRRGLFFCSMLVLLGCGGKQERVGIQFVGTGPVALVDPQVADVVFLFRSLPSDEGVLDTDGNGQADSFLFPKSCSSLSEAACGFSPSEGGSQVRLGDLPLGYRYSIEVRLRDLSGNTLYSGFTEFLNEAEAMDISMSISEVNS